MNDYACTCSLPVLDLPACRPARHAAFGEDAHGAKDAFGLKRGPVSPVRAARGRPFAADRLVWEIEHACGIQRHGLPAPLELGAGLGIAGVNLPATHLSGDIYDFVRCGRKVYFLLCDVSGKGVGSAMIAAHLGRAFRVGARRGWSLEALDDELHETAAEAGGSEKFATGILGMLDLESRRVQLAAAGHAAPSVVGADGGDKVTDGAGLVHCWGSLLGVRIAPPIATARFGPGQSMVFYTDGVSDQCGPDGDTREWFGRGGVAAAHAGFAGGTAEDLCGHVLSEALRFGNSAASLDDMTVLALHWAR